MRYALGPVGNRFNMLKHNGKVFQILIKINCNTFDEIHLYL